MTLAAATGRSRSSTVCPAGEAEAEALRRRARRLVEATIDYVPNPRFSLDEPEDENPLVHRTLTAEDADHHATPPDLPAHLRRLCESKLLDRQQEAALFREMNRLKFLADRTRHSLCLERPDPRSVERIKQSLARAERIRDHLIRCNMRLVISIVKKYVTPSCPFDEMLSDGIVTLMQAVEKFDFDRGFRFSTYAYRAIARGAFQTVANARREEARMTRDAEHWAFEQDDGTSSSLSDQVWENLHRLTAAMLDRLDRRERFIIRGRYALGAHRKVLTFQSLADKLGISKERARQIEQRAVGKLRAMAAQLETDELFGASLA